MVVVYESNVEGFKQGVSDLNQFVKEVREEGIRNLPRKIYQSAKNNPERTAKIALLAGILTYGALTTDWKALPNLVEGPVHVKP